ncbi:hypothetical protein SORBI_3010G191400 [Sorghum bicolor]|uniref:Meg domain-containing protein n=1 Tax=Sorghum bicolor TaxID=4558 RepID=A0A194YK51_SORBI|nr:hypothetical protein SORBI_3010G191400 [Sorghum bicolor]
MEKHTLDNDVLVFLLVLLLGCFSIHAECRAVMDEMDNQNIYASGRCIQSDIRRCHGPVVLCYCCANDRTRCSGFLSQCEKMCSRQKTN